MDVRAAIALGRARALASADARLRTPKAKG
jgi:hypothetical protein